MTTALLVLCKVLIWIFAIYAVGFTIMIILIHFDQGHVCGDDAIASAAWPIILISFVAGFIWLAIHTKQDILPKKERGP